MYRHLFCLFTGLIFVSVFSCKKKKNDANVIPPTGIADTSTYSAMKTGNYWIYQGYRLDSFNGSAYAEGIFDSAYVEKDSVINGVTYHKYVEPDFNPGDKIISFLRDSFGYIVNNEGRILFSADNFHDTFYKFYFYNPAVLYDSVRITEQMDFKDVKISTNAGNFTTSTFRQIWHMPPSVPYGPIRERDILRSKGVGVTRKTRGFYSVTQDIYEWRLERYHLL